MSTRAPALALVGVLALGGVAACSEQDQAEVEQQLDETGQKVKEGADKAGDEISEQVGEGAEEEGEGGG
jgi:hypothetical protein